MTVIDETHATGCNKTITSEIHSLCTQVNAILNGALTGKTQEITTNCLSHFIGILHTDTAEERPGI